MIRINPHREPTWFELLPGVRVKVAPVTTAVMMAARRDEAVRAAAEGDEAGVEIAVGKALARLTIVDWEGVADEAGQPVAVTPEGIGHLLDIWPVWLAWASQVLATFVAMDAEKNASAPSPTGSSARAQDTAPDATASAKTARAS